MQVVPTFSRKRTYGDYNQGAVVPYFNKKRSTYYARAGRSAGQNPSYRRGGRGSGPYNQLSMGSRHTHPIYPRPEAKYIDMTATGIVQVDAVVTQPIDETWGIAGNAVGMFNAITQGTGSTNRLGPTIAVKSCAYRFEVDLGPTPVPTSGRVVLVWDHQPNASALAGTTIFQQVNYLSYLDIGVADRFTVLRNDKFSLSPNGDQTLFFEGYVKLNMRTSWGADITGAAIPQTGQIWLLTISDQATLANQPLITGNWRFRFYDC